MIEVGLIAANSAVGPALARSAAGRDWAAFRHSYLTGSVVAGALGTMLAIGIGLLAEPILGLFGKDFESGATLLRILLLGRVVNCLSGPCGNALLMLGRERIQMIIMTSTSVAGLVLIPLGYSGWGMIGVAWLSALSIALPSLLAVAVLTMTGTVRRQVGGCT